MFDEGTERRDACARANHDHGSVTIFGQAEVFIRVRVDIDRLAGMRSVSEVRGSNAFAIAPMAVVTDGSYSEMDFVGMRQQAGGDRVKARRHFPQQAGEGLSG